MAPDTTHRPFSSSIHAETQEGLVGTLNREWAQLTALSSSDSAVREWAANEPALGRCASLRDLQRRCEHSTAAQTDAILLALLQTTGDTAPLARRTLLQLMLPKVFSLYRYQCRFRQVGASHLERQAAAVAAMWEAIVTYPMHRRTGVAGTLALDTLNKIGGSRTRTREQIRTVAVREDWFAHLPAEAYSPLVSVREALSDPEADNSQVSVHELLAFALDRGAISTQDAELLRQAYLLGTPTELMAQQVGISPASLRKRLSRAVGRLHRMAMGLQIEASGSSTDSASAA